MSTPAIRSWLNYIFLRIDKVTINNRISVKINFKMFLLLGIFCLLLSKLNAQIIFKTIRLSIPTNQVKAEFKKYCKRNNIKLPSVPIHNSFIKIDNYAIRSDRVNTAFTIKELFHYVTKEKIQELAQLAPNHFLSPLLKYATVVRNKELGYEDKVNVIVPLSSISQIIQNVKIGLNLNNITEEDLFTIDEILDSFSRSACSSTPFEINCQAHLSVEQNLQDWLWEVLVKRNLVNSIKKRVKSKERSK